MMTRSYKMLTLLAMLNKDQLPGALPFDALAEGFARLARRSAKLRLDVGDALENDKALRKHLEKNPINAWAGGSGTKGKKFFAYEDGVFRTKFNVAFEEREAFQELVREFADWRLGEYLDRSVSPNEGIVCKVLHLNQKPVLLLPNRKKTPGHG